MHEEMMKEGRKEGRKEGMRMDDDDDDDDDGDQLGGLKTSSSTKRETGEEGHLKTNKFSWKDGWHGVAGSNVNQEKCNIPSAMACTYLFFQ